MSQDTVIVQKDKSLQAAQARSVMPTEILAIYSDNNDKQSFRGRALVPKKLKVDKDFIPYPLTDEYEVFPNGIFEFNITGILEYIQENPGRINLTSVKVKDYCRESSSRDEFDVASVISSHPVILAEISPSRYNLIDGHHRIEKARRMGRENILAYCLTVSQHMKFLTNKKAYLAYIEYWNDKLDEMDSGFPRG